MPILRIATGSTLTLVSMSCGGDASWMPDGSSSAVTSEATASAPTAVVAPELAPQPSSTAQLERNLPAAMALIPAGSFMMGGEGPETTPRHRVWVAAFALDRTEVTTADYALCVDAQKCKPPGRNNPFCNALFADRPRHPVNCVNAHDADAYCAFVGKRLPTEREWEYAARGGKEQRTYSWGEEAPDSTRACYAHAGTCQVGSFPAGAFGLLDMSGNVWEWTSSYLSNYPNEAVEGLFRVYRGGSWSRRFPKWLRNDLRNRYRTAESSAALGLRCAKSLSPTACGDGARVVGDRCIGTADPEPKAQPANSQPRPTHPNPNREPPTAVDRATGPTDAPPLRTRAAQFDADCRHYPGFPYAHTWSGGTYAAREPLIAKAGCVKRDIGVGWTSACCPQ